MALLSLRFVILCGMIVVLLSTLTIILWPGSKHVRLRGTLAVGTIIFIIRTIDHVRSGGFLHDFKIFRAVGFDVWRGLDPYASDHFFLHPFLNPPTATPLFAAFAMLPLWWSSIVWAGLNLVAGIALVTLAKLCLIAQGVYNDRLSRRDEICVLTLALVLSSAAVEGFILGQLSLFTSTALLFALIAQGRGKPVWAGLWLGVATVKIGTMVPFLVLFLRKQDRPAWVSLCVVVIVLCLIGGPVSELPHRLQEYTHRIEQLGSEGHVNDYSDASRSTANLIGFDHALYNLGLSDRRSLRTAQFAVLGVLGALLYREVTRRPELSRGAACSLIALYSVLFLYHRSYDTTLLVIPLVYAISTIPSAHGWRRGLLVMSAIAILIVLNIPAESLRKLAPISSTWGIWRRIVRGIAFPLATWTVLFALLSLWLSERIDGATSRVECANEPISPAPPSYETGMAKILGEAQ